jgi:hypothetical protein
MEYGTEKRHSTDDFLSTLWRYLDFRLSECGCGDTVPFEMEDAMRYPRVTKRTNPADIPAIRAEQARIRELVKADRRLLAAERRAAKRTGRGA